MSEKDPIFTADDVICTYTSADAEADGVLIHYAPITPGRWYFTIGVHEAIESKKDGRSYFQKLTPLMCDALMLVNATLKKNRDEHLITEGLEGNVTGRPLWVGRNETSGWTVMFPEEN